jgi:septal ring factor EnvC (AmiA/AmiB activator)
MPSKLEERVTRHDREIAAIRKLILTGMKMLDRTDRQIDAIVGSIDRLSAAQRETDRMLKSLIASLGRGTNGHSKD